MRPQSTNWMPSLKVARTARTNSTSSMRSESLKARRCGTVASPTPTVPMSSDSMSWIETGNSSVRASAAAAIQPADPPPTRTMLLSRSVTPGLWHRSPALTAPRCQCGRLATLSELDAKRSAQRPRHSGDVAVAVVAATGDEAVRTALIDEVDEVLFVRHVERVESQV